MSVHLTETARFHSWEATPCPDVGEPADSAFIKETDDKAYLMNKESPREFIFCDKSLLVEVEK